jgi:putative ABC transport system substrate-binding protein
MTYASRRKFLLASSALIASTRTFADSKSKTWRIGFLGVGSIASAGHFFEEFAHGLLTLGYIEGSNVAFERRWADNHEDRLPLLAKEIVEANVDVIVAPVSAAIHAARLATQTIPIIGVLTQFPIENGFALSLAQPGKNFTGTTTSPVELVGKRIEFLKEIFPKASRAAILSSNDRTDALLETESARICKLVGVQIFTVQAKDVESLEVALSKVQQWRPDSFIPLPTNLAFRERSRLVQFASRNRLPAVYGPTEMAEVGGLLSYGPNYKALYRRAASFVDRILKGSSPANLPIERPASFELTVNLKTATNLGIKVPPTVLLRATKVIE